MLHELWADSEGLPSLLLAGPHGEDARRSLGPSARLVDTFEASSHFEAMTIYYRLLGRGEYTTDQEWDFRTYKSMGWE